MTTTEARVHIEHSGDGTTATFAKDDLQARNAAKAAGFRWSRNLGAWFLPRTYTEPTRRARARQFAASLPDGDVHLADGGQAPTTTAAQREAAAQERAAARAERMDARADRLEQESTGRAQAASGAVAGIPFGQPILVGHHSERRHRNALARSGAHMRASIAAADEAERAERAAANARRTATGPSPLARLRRIERAEADLRRAEREVAQLEARGGRAAAPGWWDQQCALAERLRDEIAHDREQVAAAGHQVLTPADIAKGDLVRYRGRWHTVVRVNRTTVSVETGYSWTDKLELHQLTAVRKPDPQG